MASPAPAAGNRQTEPRESAPVLFISDLHLTPERPEAVALFRRFLVKVAAGAAALYILGDFLESWVGDDELADPFNQALVRDLAQLSAQGTRLHFLPGNRDFLLGKDFAQATGLELLPDPCPIDLFGIPTLLSHGDLFCSDDTAYQTFRAQVRDPGWQSNFLAQPLPVRRELARALRERSETAKAGKKPDIMDVNEATLLHYLATWNVKRLIHGHTHRPAKHVHLVDGTPVERWVLPDWYEQGGYLRCDALGCRALPFS